MPFDGSGNYTPAAAPNFPAVGGTVISSSYYNNVINDIATALSNTLTRDGQGKPSADLNWNGKSLTNMNNLGAVTAAFSSNVTIGGTLVTTGLSTFNGNIGGTPTFTGNVNFGANVQIGSTFGTPASALDIQRAGTATAQIYARNASHNVSIWADASQTLLGAVTNSNLLFVQNNIERMRLDTNGSLNIGVTTSTAKLSVFDDNNEIMRLDRTAGSTYGYVGFYTAGVRRGIVGADPNNNLAIYGDTHVSLYAGGSERARILSTGEAIFGGGTVSSGGLLELRKDQNAATTFKVYNNNAGAAAQARIDLSTGTANSYTIFAVVDNAASPYRSMSNGTGVLTSYDDSNNHYFRTNAGATKVMFDGAGNVAIGTSFGGPTGALDIQRSGTATAQIYARNSSHIASLWADSSQVLVGATTNSAFLLVQNNVERYRINTSGVLVDAAGNELGYKDLPQNAQAAGYALVITDRGKHVYCTGSAAAVTIPPNSSVAFPVGTACTIINDGSGARTLTQGAGVTLKWAGTGTTGNRTLAIGGMATLIKVATDTWYVSGAGLS